MFKPQFDLAFTSSDFIKIPIMKRLTFRNLLILYDCNLHQFFIEFQALHCFTFFRVAFMALGRRRISLGKLMKKKVKWSKVEYKKFSHSQSGVIHKVRPCVRLVERLKDFWTHSTWRHSTTHPLLFPFSTLTQPSPLSCHFFDEQFSHTFR